ncbi:MAG: ribonuclease III [Gammaproteobacteria bacterium]|nr:ribonuclease III [Gammaproteobacteria bacterium]
MIRKPEVLAKKLGLTFNQPQLLVTALTHRSAGANNNERLEFLGDAILGFVVAQHLFDAHPTADEGTLSRLRASLVNETSLADMARKHQLGDYLLLGSGELKSGGFRRDSILSDALEAIIGALYKDQGIEVCQQWVGRLFADDFKNLSINNWQKDPKTQLQELMQAKKLELPDYSLVDMAGLPHEQVFTVNCRISLFPENTVGVGVSRKKAEQAAAELMLAKIQNNQL